MKNITEKQLIRQIQLGDNQAFDVLAAKYRQRIERAVSHYTYEKSAVNDITQETLLRAFEGLPAFHGQCQFYTWLYRIAINTAKNYARKNSKSVVEVDVDSQTAEYLLTKKYQFDDDMDPRKMAEDLEIYIAIDNAIEALPLSLRNTLLMKEEGDLAYKEIADTCHCPTGTIRSRMYRARELVVLHAIAELMHYNQDKINDAMVIMNKIRKGTKG